jgi:hypothetical protein
MIYQAKAAANHLRDTIHRVNQMRIRAKNMEKRGTMRIIWKNLTKEFRCNSIWILHHRLIRYRLRENPISLFIPLSERSRLRGKKTWSKTMGMMDMAGMVLLWWTSPGPPFMIYNNSLPIQKGITI